MRKCSDRVCRYVVFLLLIFGPVAAAPAQQTVALPVTIDYSLLRSLMIERAFPEDQESITLVNEGDGCINLVLSRPQVSEQNGMLRVEMNLFARGGTPIAGNCYASLEWRGYLVLYQQPAIADHNWRLVFSTTKAELLGTDRQKVEIADLLWGLIQSNALSYVDDIVIDLMPPVNEIKEFLLPLFPETFQAQTMRMLDSMRPGSLQVGPDALQLAILADVEATYEHEDSQLKPLDREALERVVTIWENWDGLLMYLAATMSHEALTNEEEHVLRNMLLDTRYEFVQALSDRTITRDFVREQFVYAWQQLSPLFRKYRLDNAEGSRALGYLAFVSSADALVVFDRIGPTFGLEISREGLLRLAGMLQLDSSLLGYRSTVSPELQELFQVAPGSRKEGTEPAAPVVPAEPDGASSDTVFSEPLATVFRFFSPAMVCAAQPSLKEILQWKVPQNNVTGYVSRVNKLLDGAAKNVWSDSDLPQIKESMFQQLITSLAWQESCFRQFVVKGKQFTYLLSYNRTSVGLMQVNERIWRGIFDRERLRWDIAYNAEAGCRITALYLGKYVLRDEKRLPKIDNDTLARLVYAMYNGGPSQYQKFLHRLEKGDLYQSDELFWEKFQWVTSGNIDKATICLTGS